MIAIKYQYEFIEYTEGLPLKAFVHSVNAYNYHWHKEMELILVMHGSVEIRVGSELYVMHENDLILLNRDEVHSTNKTNEDNILLVLQISPEYFGSHYPDLKRMTFTCKSIADETATNGLYDIIRQKLADVIWSINKRNDGYKLEIMGHVHQMLAHLVKNFDYEIVDERNMELHEKDLVRLKRITDYVNENYQEKITLSDLAKREFLSFYYLSHFIKDKMGISFQTYLTEIRLENAVRVLNTTKKTISEIVFEAGFPNSKAFNKAFKAKYNTTPTAYRKQLSELSYGDGIQAKVMMSDPNAKYYLDFDKSAALKKILKYRSRQYPGGVASTGIDYSSLKVEHRKIEISMPTDGVKIGRKGFEEKKISQSWKRLMTFGRAAEGLRSEFKAQLEKIQSEIGFEFARFHGIFNDEMMVVRRVGRRDVAYNWVYVDALFDTLLDNGLKPFIELGFMPSLFRSGEKTVFEWKGNISPPTDLEDWTKLVRAFVAHLINRYGLDTVLTWRFEVWNEPDLEDFFWTGTPQEYYELYNATASVIKSIHPKLQVGGPAVVYVSLFNSEFTRKFLMYCKENCVPIDFFTYHVYSEKMPVNEETLTFKERFEKIGDFQRNQFHDEDHLINCIHDYDEMIVSCYGEKLPVYITEWNSSAWSRNLLHDTCFKAPYILENAVRTDGMVEGLGYWTFTDLFEEWGAGPSEFHGGFGLLTRSGIPKAGYYAYVFLNKLGNSVIDRGDGYIVTSKSGGIQILMWNFAYYDTLYKTGDESVLDSKNRYDVFEDKQDLLFKIDLDMQCGRYRIARSLLRRGSGSAVDVWIGMGAPEHLGSEDIAYMKSVSVPNRTIEIVGIEKKLELQSRLPVHGVELIEISEMI